MVHKIEILRRNPSTSATRPATVARPVVSRGEIDPAFENKQVLLADAEDGVALTAQQLVLVAPGDAAGGRYVSGVTRLRLGSADRS
jgi:hypothetical protein